MRVSENIIETRIPMVDHMMENAEKTAKFLKSLAHPARLIILCRLSEAPTSVGELEATLQLAQPVVSKLLGQLRKEGLVTTQRDGRSIIYHLADDRTRQIVGKLYEQFCD